MHDPLVSDVIKEADKHLDAFRFYTAIENIAKGKNQISWEYSFLQVKIGESIMDYDYGEALVNLGKLGWEVCAATNQVIILKRRSVKSNKPQEEST